MLGWDLQVERQIQVVSGNTALDLDKEICEHLLKNGMGMAPFVFGCREIEKEKWLKTLQSD